MNKRLDLEFTLKIITYNIKIKTEEILMQKIIIILVFCLSIFSFNTYAEDKNMKIKLTINNHDDVIIVLQNNANIGKKYGLLSQM